MSVCRVATLIALNIFSTTLPPFDTVTDVINVSAIAQSL